MKLLKDHQIAEVKMSYSPDIDISIAPKITGSGDAAKCFSQDWEDVQYIERFKIMLLTRSNRVKGIVSISQGGLTACIVDTKIILQAALLSNSSSIIIAHNHPSGNLEASEADKKITQTIKEACKFQDIALLDHVIITANGYYSFADEGLL
ncbi:MAG: JAB domain-containing protein [Bacteroidales bacterium]